MSGVATDTVPKGSGVSDRIRSIVTPRGRLSWRGAAARILPPLVFSVLVIVGWGLYVRLFDVSEAALPSPAQVWDALVENSANYWDNAQVTIKEILIGLALAMLIGVTLGALIRLSRTIERAVYPWLVVSQLVPIPAIAPIFVIWFGFDMRPKILVVALVSFFPIVVNTVDGLRAVEPELVNLLRTLGASRWKIFRSAQLPAAMPFIFSGMKIAAAFSVIGAVFGEWVGASEGLGYLILIQNNQTDTAQVFAIVVWLAAIGIGLFALISLIERITLPWYHQARRGERL